MPPLSVLIKPASGRCNMRCRYCFYADETRLRGQPDLGLMSEGTMQAVILRTLQFAAGSCSYGFQGGEPTLRGLDFFRRFVAFARANCPAGVKLQFFLQTNGLLLDEDWAAFLKENGFLVGLSLDGDRPLQDLYRLDAAGAGSFDRVAAAARLLQRAGVEYNLLTVVTAQTARRIRQVYRFFLRNGFTNQQYIPCLDPLGQPRGGNPWSLTAQAYGDFLIRLFDAWYADRLAGRPVYIRYFENLAGMLRGRPPESCGMMGRCSLQTVVEADGSVYPCDFYMLDDYRLGNLNTDTMEQINARRPDSGFLAEGAQGLEECARCPFGPLCRGGCRRDRQLEGLHRVGQNYFCPAYRRFFAHALPGLRQLAGLR